MGSLRFFCLTCYEKMGLFVPFENEKDSWKGNLKKVYVLFQHSVMWIGVFAHFFNTVSRSHRYSPELFQSIFEDFIFAPAALVIGHMSLNKENNEIFVKLTERYFSMPNGKVMQKCEHQAKLVFIVIACLVTVSNCGSLLESLIPLSAKELEIRRLVFQTKNPKRRHPVNFRFPWVDETESWAFVIIYVFFVYWDIVFCSMLVLCVSTFPIILIHMKGQYEILSQFTEKIGRRHTDVNGVDIVYTNIETNDFYYVMPKNRGRVYDKENLIQRHQYNQRYVNQIIQFHQKLLLAHEKVNPKDKLQVGSQP